MMRSVAVYRLLSGEMTFACCMVVRGIRLACANSTKKRFDFHLSEEFLVDGLAVGIHTVHDVLGRTLWMRVSVST